MATQSMTAVPKPRFRLKIGRIVIYLILLSFSFFYILPVYLILITSFKQYTDINLYRMWEFPPLLFLNECTNPLLFCFDSFYEAWFGSAAVIGMGQAFFNSGNLSMPISSSPLCFLACSFRTNPS